MSNHYFPATQPAARKPHRCVACWHDIPTGEKHYQQDGIFEGKMWRARYHAECWETVCNSEDFDFSPGELDPPARLTVVAVVRYFRYRDKGRAYSSGNSRWALEPNGLLWTHSVYSAPAWIPAGHNLEHQIETSPLLEEFVPNDFVLPNK